MVMIRNRHVSHVMERLPRLYSKMVSHPPLLLPWVEGLWSMAPGTQLEVPTIYKAYVRAMSGDIPPKYGLIWYSISILGSWNSHWFNSPSIPSGELPLSSLRTPRSMAHFSLATNATQIDDDDDDDVGRPGTIPEGNEGLHGTIPAENGGFHGKIIQKWWFFCPLPWKNWGEISGENSKTWIEAH